MFPSKVGCADDADLRSHVDNFFLGYDTLSHYR